MSEPLDAAQTGSRHGGPSFSLGNRVERAAFAVIWRLSGWLVPPPFGWGWRRFLLQLFGAQLGTGARVYPSARIWLPRNLVMEPWSSIGPGVQCYNQARIALGEGAIVSQRAFLCSGDHDHRDPAHQLVTRPIVIEAGAWVAAEAFVGPGVTIGKDAVLGARGCAMKDIPPATVWAGNPAAQVAERQVR
ncbi:putative colanic acid biosynthesis acetyltransferase [Erythrobacter sp. SDW2]|uniref:putative colanic acid biosynthesis acetyltransferase n=1 Tax=Erythrobacter sp. SDW2 TaxID=2907154 RepID=UPI001F395ED1|nr:putative colanic acid biosynthesis acetyltransferase [Erythrobacter sp. SDW2]UIP07460.1 putative colanic acid biosynthesis acetyltransferase [Erythrobacter sp. SDW2]